MNSELYFLVRARVSSLIAFWDFRLSPFIERICFVSLIVSDFLMNLVNPFAGLSASSGIGGLFGINCNVATPEPEA